MKEMIGRIVRDTPLSFQGNTKVIDLIEQSKEKEGKK